MNEVKTITILTTMLDTALSPSLSVCLSFGLSVCVSLCLLVSQVVQLLDNFFRDTVISWRGQSTRTVL